MKNRVKDFLIISILFGVFVTVTLIASTDKGANEPDYTVFSTNENGVSLLFDTFKRMKYPVEIGYQRIDIDTGVNDINIITQSEIQEFNNDVYDILDWVYMGGRLVYLDNEKTSILETMLEENYIYSDGYFTLYSYGYGEVLIGYAGSVTNQTLMSDRTGGKTIQAFIDDWGYKKIIFSEYYHGYQSNQENANQGSGVSQLWRDMPGWFKVLTYQVILSVLLILFMLGKRFGRALPYYVIEERDENEYLFSLSSIYINAGLGSIIIENYYKNFIWLCGMFFNQQGSYSGDNLEELWEANKLPQLDILRETKVLMEGNSFNTKQRGQRKQFFKLISHIDKLSSEVKR